MRQAPQNGPSQLNHNVWLLSQIVEFAVREVAVKFKTAQTTASKLTFEEILPLVELEVLVLYLHLFDRQAFVGLDSTARATFSDLLFNCVAEHEGVRCGINDETDLCDFVDQFARICNLRGDWYSEYKKLVPESDKDSVAGTLLWEFGKRLGFRYHGFNFAGLQLFLLAVFDNFIKLAKVTKQLRLLDSEDGPKFIKLIEGDNIPDDLCRCCGAPVFLGDEVVLVAKETEYLVLHREECAGQYLLAY